MRGGVEQARARWLQQLLPTGLCSMQKKSRPWRAAYAFPRALWHDEVHRRPPVCVTIPVPSQVPSVRVNSEPVQFAYWM